MKHALRIYLLGQWQRMSCSHIRGELKKIGMRSSIAIFSTYCLYLSVVDSH